MSLRKAGFPTSAGVANLLPKDYSFRSPVGGSGTFYAGGFYEAAAASIALNQGSLTQTFIAANQSHAAHAFIVAAAAGTTDGSDLKITVSGTSITDLAVRTPGDSEVLTVDATALVTNQYLETNKKWIGTITYTISSTAGSTYAFTFNYGVAKYEDFGNRNFKITDIEITGRAGANDSGFNVGLMEHKTTGWTYHATAFVPGTGYLYDMNTDHVTEKNLVSGEPIAWKRASLNYNISATGFAGAVFKIITSANNAVGSMNLHLMVEI